MPKLTTYQSPPRLTLSFTEKGAEAQRHPMVLESSVLKGLR